MSDFEGPFQADTEIMLGPERSEVALSFPEKRLRVIERMEYQMVGLQSLLMREAVECGVYIGYGSRNMVSMVLDVVAKKPVPEVIWIDAGNSFDPYRLAVSARRRGWNPGSVLKSIKVARPFTAFQLHEVIAKVPRSASPAGAAPAGAAPPLVIISDLMGLFYDADLPEEDLKRAFRQFQERLAELGRRAVVIGLVLNQPIPAERKHLLPAVLGLARRVFAPSCTAAEELGAPVRRLAALTSALLLSGGWILFKKISEALSHG